MECAAEEHRASDEFSKPDEAALDDAARLFRAISDVERLRLIVLLARGEACVTELAAAEGVTLSTLSQRLRVLRSEDLVVRRRKGKHINYALADQHIADLVRGVLEHVSEV